jgi:hypothetical protein
MTPKKLEEGLDRVFDRVCNAGDEHFAGKRDDKSTMVQNANGNSAARVASGIINTRRQEIRERLADRSLAALAAA